MQKFNNISISIRVAIAMLITFVLAIGNVSTASAVGSTAQTITFAQPTTPQYYGAGFNASATTTASGLAVTITVDPTSALVCAISDGWVTLRAVGSCKLNAEQPGDVTYAAATTVSRTVTVNAKPLTITSTIASTNFWSDVTPPAVNYTVTGLATGDAISGVTHTYTGDSSATTTRPTAPGYFTITPSSPVFTSGSASNYAITYNSVSYCAIDATRRSADGAILCFSSPADLSGIAPLEFGYDRATSKFTDWVKGGVAKTPLTNQASGAAQYKGGYLPAVNVSITAYYIRPNDGPGNCISYVYGAGSTTMQVGNGGSGSASSNSAFWSGTNNGGFGGYTGATGTALAVNVTYTKAAGNSTNPVGWYVVCQAGGSTWSSANFSAVQVRPVISTISTNNGYVAGGTSLTIAGLSFSTGSPAATVTVGGVPCVISAQTATSITCTTGAGTAGTVDVVVTNADGVTGTKAASFTYAVPATVAPTNSVAPTITSAGVITTPGSTLVANIGTWDTQGDNFTATGYQWQICTTDQLASSCANVSGATAQTWVSTAAAANRYVRVGVTITNDAGSTTVYSPMTALLDKTSQSITFNNFANAAYGDADVSPIATSSAGGTIVYTIDSSSTATCSIVAAKVHFTTVGTCVVNANAASTDQVNAATQVQKTLTITKKALTLTPTIAKNSFWTTDAFPAVSFTASGLATGETISGVTYNYNNGTTSVTSAPTTPGAYTMTAIDPVFSVGSADNYTVTSGSTNFCLNDGAQKNASGFNVCFNGAWQTTDINELAYGWDYSQNKYTNWVKAGEAKTVLADQSNGLTQLNGAKVGNISGLAVGYYTPSVQEQVTCQVYTRGTGSSSVSFGGGSASTSASNGSAVATVSATIPAGTPTLFSASFTNAGNQSFPISWYVLCSVNGGAYAPMDVSKLSAVIRPTITSVSPATGLPVGGNTITITGANFGAGGATVTIDGVNCPVVGTNSATSITCTVPAGTSGLADVAVTAANGTAAGGTVTKANAYSYEAATYPAPTGSVDPVISTTATSNPIPIGSPMVSTLGTWDMNGDPTTTTTVKWQACSDSQGLLCTDIAGATGTPWVATADVAVKYLRSVVIATNNGGSVTANSNILGPFAKANQTIAFTSVIASKSVGVADFYPAITYNPATPVRAATLSTTTPAVCSIVDNKIHIVAIGTCGITAAMVGDDTFNAATSVSTSFAVVTPSFATPVLGSMKWADAYSFQYVYSNPNAVFTVTSGTLPRGLTLSSSGLLSGVPLNKPGETLSWQVTATDDSGSTAVNSSITITKGIVIGSFSMALTLTTFNGQKYLPVTSASGAIARGVFPIVPVGQEAKWVQYGSRTPTVCSVDDFGKLTILKAGICIIGSGGADQTWGTSMSYGGTWQSLVSMPAPLKANTITFAQPADVPFGATDFALVAKATSGVAPTLTSSTPLVCTIMAGKVHMVAAGDCTVSAADASSASFAAAPSITKTFKVLEAPDAPTITAATAVGAVGTSALVTFTAGDLNGWTLSNYQVTATPSAGQFGFPSTVTCPTAGVACVVIGLTPGVEYTFVASTLAASGKLTTKVDSAPSTPVVALLPQVIELPSPGVKRPDAGSFPLFPVSDIGSVVVPVVTSATPLVCSVDSNNVVTIIAAGTCTLNASSPSVTARGITYGDAAPLSVSFPVSTTAPAVTTVSPLAPLTVGVAATIVNTAAAGSAVIPVGVAGTWSATGLPAGLVIDSKTGKISGTPTAAGVYNQILVSVKDKAGVVASKPLTLTVAAGPGIIGPTTVAVIKDQAVTVSGLVALPGTSSIPTTSAWAVTAGTLPVGLTLNPDTGVVSGTPTGVVGKVTVTITLTDSAPLTASKVLTFDVAAAPKFGAAGATNPAPTVNLAAVAAVKLPVGGLFAPVVVPGTAGKPAKGAFTAVPTGSSTALPDGVVFNPDNGSITGTPLVPGVYDFKVIFTDAKGLTAEQPYHLVVAAPPTIENAATLPVYTVGTSPALNINLDGTRGTNALSGTAGWSLVAPSVLPVGLSLDGATGIITGTPPTSLTKDYSFTIKLTDSGDVSGSALSATRTFTLPVIKAGVNKTTLVLPVEIASGTLFTDELYDLNGDSTLSPVLAATGASSMNLAVTYGVTATSVSTCFVDAEKLLHIIGAGVCGVTATSGTAAARNVSVATTSFVVSKRSQVLTVTAPGEVVEGSDPEVTAAEATDDPAGFKLAASLTSGLDPVYTVIPAKNPNGSDKEPNCAVDEAGNVTWLYDMTLATTAPGYDVNGSKCRVAISHAGNTNYSSVATQFLDLVVTHVTPSAPNDDDNVEPGVSIGLPRTGGTVSKGGVGFTVKVTPTGVTVQPISSGLYIGPITANISVEYKVNNVVQSQACTTSFGIAILDAKKKVITNPALETKAAIAAITKPYRAMPKGGPKGYLASKKFTNSVTCALNKDAIAFFKAGGQLKANAQVIRDRRWPTTYKAAKPNGEKIAPKTVNWVLKVG